MRTFKVTIYSLWIHDGEMLHTEILCELTIIAKSFEEVHKKVKKITDLKYTIEDVALIGG